MASTPLLPLQATALTRSHRPFINPNPGFLKQLGLYEVGAADCL